MHYRPLQTREVTRLPGGSAAALERPGADLIEFEVGRLAGGTAGREKL
jgi:hypothetical protein